ncbi:hypothetical protein DY000_02006723 [Brassica cretica]|uniref:Uncharacterized protein n=1 Tax=Brassica cretica TaxID=69181 RepID=A0ABQ7CK40_BRACR|nr:hypothetical protein DY000_02006723 [Brassica cretica]
MTSGSRGASGFPNDLRVPSNLRLQNDLRVLNTTSGSEGTFGTTVPFDPRIQLLNLRVHKRDLLSLGKNSRVTHLRKVECDASLYSKFTNLTHLVPSLSLPKGSWTTHWTTLPGFDNGKHCSKKPTYQSTRVYPTEATSSRKYIREGPLEGPHNHQVPGKKFKQPQGSRTQVHPASGFQDESPSSLRVPGRNSIQPPGSRTKVHPASGFQDESLSSLRVPGRKSVQPPDSRMKFHPTFGFRDENPYNL